VPDIENNNSQYRLNCYSNSFVSHTKSISPAVNKNSSISEAVLFEALGAPFGGKSDKFWDKKVPSQQCAATGHGLSSLRRLTGAESKEASSVQFFNNLEGLVFGAGVDSNHILTFFHERSILGYEMDNASIARRVSRQIPCTSSLLCQCCGLRSILRTKIVREECAVILL
jgi:hypothetical protein